MLKKIISFLALMSLITMNAAAAPSKWAVEEVNRARAEGLVPESIKSNYQNPITREEFCEIAVLFYDKFNVPYTASGAVPFTDTDNKNIIKAYEVGIVKGTGENVFSPDTYVTRQEICAMLTRALTSAIPNIYIAEKYPNTFPDMQSISDWALIPVQFINMKGVILGDEKGNIDPLANTTREQAIALVYRLYRTLSDEVNEKIAGYLFTSSGNTSANMLNGAFAIVAGNGTVYLSDQNGVKTLSPEAVLISGPASNLYALSDCLYYINSADRKMYSYSLPGGGITKICDDEVSAFAPIGTKIYYINKSDGGKIYSVKPDGSERILISDIPAEMPISSGNTLYFSDGGKIYKIGPDKITNVVYEGPNRRFCISNGTLYFLNEQNLLCSFVENDGEFRILTSIPVTAFCPLTNFIVFCGGADNAMYKVDRNGRAAIRIDDGAYVSVNTYVDYVFGKTAEGEIYRFAADSTGKMKLN